MLRTSRNKSESKSARLINAGLLKSWPLPGLEDGGDKELRGRVIVIAGCAEMPGAAILAATAALRAGAGKLQIAAPASAAPWIAMGVPEALVMSLPESKGRLLVPGCVKLLRSRLELADAVLIGPGMAAGASLPKLLKKLMPFLKNKILVLDAEALVSVDKLQKDFQRFDIQVIITPHAGEMAKLLKIEKEQVQQNPESTARDFAVASKVTTVLKGSETFIADSEAKVFKNTAGNVGLGISGSGDTLAGIIAGLAARGAGPSQAAAWGVHLHACAGDVLARRLGPLGYLPREILLEIPGLLKKFS